VTGEVRGSSGEFVGPEHASSRPSRAARTASNANCGGAWPHLSRLESRCATRRFVVDAENAHCRQPGDWPEAAGALCPKRAGLLRITAETLSGVVVATSTRHQPGRDEGRGALVPAPAPDPHENCKFRNDLMPVPVPAGCDNTSGSVRYSRERSSAKRRRLPSLAPRRRCHTCQRASVLPNRSTARAMSTARIVPPARSTVACPSAGRPTTDR
jgi:hypothetical protein